MVVAAAWPLIEAEAEQRRLRDGELRSSVPAVQPDVEPAQDFYARAGENSGENSDSFRADNNDDRSIFATGATTPP